jgi:uncharacterized protein with HEPN domain
MQRTIRARLADILDAIRGIEDTVGGIGFDTYLDVWHMRRATERGIEIISEASRHIPEDLKALFPDVPWIDIATIGNILRHEYARVDDQIIWNIVETDLPALEVATRALVKLAEERGL